MARLPILVGALAAAVTFGAVMLVSDKEGKEAAPATTATAGLAVFHRMGCGSCHRLAAAGRPAWSDRT